MPALSAKEIRELVRVVRESGGRAGTRIALELLLLTFVRKRELIQATWSEIDCDAAEWRIPAERMKAREMHVVPLSRQSLELFKQAKKLSSGSKYVFPGLSSHAKPLSDTALNNALLRLGFGHFSPHGFRRTASTILNELGWRPDVIERQLAHQERNKIRAAYNKATYLEDRTKMMQAWADHVDAIIAGAKVVPIGKVKTA
jgi:integrase